MIIALTWTENYGDSSESASLAESFGKAYTLIMSGAWGEFSGSEGDEGIGLAPVMYVSPRLALVSCLWVPSSHPPAPCSLSPPHALHHPPADPKFALLGAMQSLFEGSMYTFVFLWTPALR